MKKVKDPQKAAAGWLYIPWHPLLLTIYPILALLGHNIGEVTVDASFRSLLIGEGAILLLFLLLYILLRNWQKAAIVAVLIVLPFFAYGHVYDYLRSVDPVALVSHRYLFPATVLLIGLVIWRLLGSRMSLDGMTLWLNMVSVLLLIFPGYQVVQYQILSRVENDEVPSGSISVPPGGAGESRPDVYYIILDAYGRSDLLEKNYEIVDERFPAALRDMGFYVAACSQSNYAKTALSLGSSLNMNYLEGLTQNGLNFEGRFLPAWALIKNNIVMAEFEKLGYQTVAFETGYSWTEFKDAGYYFSAPPSAVNGFEGMLINTSALVVLRNTGLFDRFSLKPEVRKYDLIQYMMGQLPEIPKIPGPKFVFVHLVIPHQPFVVGPNGELSILAEGTLDNEDSYSREDYVKGYANQLAFIGNEMPRVLQGIIQNSPIPPIIIVQGDHGPARGSPRSRMGILNAYYFPDDGTGLYPGITPVNTFRLLFDTYFNAHLPLLEDHSYYSKNENVYDFQEIPVKCDVSQ